MEKLVSQLLATSPWEGTAALIGLAYLLLAVRRNLLCWLCAFVSTSIYLVLFARAALYMQSLLQVFYLAMAVYGFIDWRKGRTAEGEVVIRSWMPAWHATVAVAVVAASVVNGWLLAHYTDAAAPYVDRLRRAQTFLRVLGIDITFSREGRAGSRIIRMRATLENTVCTVSSVRDPGPRVGITSAGTGR